ncbi:MAG: family 1 encapsulin nanocompartment shell protein [Candidatus Kapaibacterium sp.]
MANNYLNRVDTPLPNNFWKEIDNVIHGAMETELFGRKLIPVEKPYGLGHKAMFGPDRIIKSKSDAISVSASSPLPLVNITKNFSLPRRDIASYVDMNSPLVLNPAIEAAEECAEYEDQMVFYGLKEAGIDGIFNHKGVQSIKLKDWKEIGTAMDDIITAITKLDNAGFNGIYKLALAPNLYNLLYRRYPQSSFTELDNLKGMVTGSIIKAHTIKEGGVLFTYDEDHAKILLGQDIQAGFVGLTGNDFEFFLSESVTLYINEPESFCILK